ncbi:MAG: AMP-binding protein [Candidatus Hodarchaeales archaeon]|jgi:long-chain acyl-CoA synthetase
MNNEMTYADKPWLKSYFIGPFKLPKTMEPYPKISVYQFLEDAADKYPDNIACVYLENEITYLELKTKVDKLATALTDMGVKKKDKVVSILPSCPQFIIVDYAIMRLGAIHVPLSILHKAPELLYEITESGAETVFCSYRRLDRVNEIKEKISIKNLIYTPVPIFPDYSLPELQPVPEAHLLEDLIEKYESNPPTVEINPTEDLALLPFTGGTTGVPKGTMLSHYNITTNVIQSLQWYMTPIARGFKGKSASLICVPIFHQYGHWAIHASVSWGLRIFLVDPRDIDQIVTILTKNRPFGVYGVPAHYMELLSKDIKKMPIFYFSGAAALPPDIAEKFEKKTGVPMSEGYGMTEASPCTHINLSALSKVTRFMKEAKRSIGVPIPDTEVKLVNPDTGEEVPFGETGEVWIRGPQIMLGYWPEIGNGLQEGGWLASGDIGKMDEDGYFYIVDRIKDMINVSGMKVYSRVIDDVLTSHPAVRMAGVIGLSDPNRPMSERVKAYIALEMGKEGEITPEDIIAFCRDKLPPYAVPKEVEFKQDLPLTLIMKVDKKKLREEELTKVK